MRPIHIKLAAILALALALVAFISLAESSGQTAPTPLEIIRQPEDCSVFEGEWVKTSVKAKGDGLTYQWYIAYPNSEYRKSIGQSSSYGFDMTPAKDGRRAYCVITDCYGNSVKTDEVQFSMKRKLELLSVQTVTVVPKGQIASVTVHAQGDGLTYKWWSKKESAQLATFLPINTATYTTTMDASCIGRSVYCEITDQYGNTLKTDPITFSYPADSAILAQPQNGVFSINATAVYQVEAQGDDLQYQWFAASPASEFAPAGTNSPSYSFNMEHDRHGLRVYCVITDRYGRSMTTDTVTAALDTRLYFVQQPVYSKVAVGEKASVSVIAEGEELTYQWWYQNPGGEKFHKASFTGDTYAVPMTEERSGRKIYCEVTDRYGVTIRSDTVTLDIQPPIVITQQPQSTSAFDGERAVAKVEATGDGLTYQWYIAGKDSEDFGLSSVTKPSYGPTMSPKTDGRKAYCVITDQYGKSVTTDTVVFTMRTTAQIVKQPVSAGAAPGEKVIVQVEAAGDNLTYTWWYKNTGDQVFSPASITSPTYSVTMTEDRNGRQLCCDISDPYGVYLTTDVVTIYMIDGLKVDKKGAVTDYSGKETELVLPQQFGKHTLTSVAKNAVKGHKTLVSVILPASVTEIGAKAFANCPALEWVDIPASVEKIGKGALLDCPKLQVICDKGSAAESYCKKNDIPYTLRNK